MSAFAAPMVFEAGLLIASSAIAGPAEGKVPADISKDELGC
jgi:hypothetical protein